jgi:hypothetical protein
MLLELPSKRPPSPSTGMKAGIPACQPISRPGGRGTCESPLTPLASPGAGARAPRPGVASKGVGTTVAFVEYQGCPPAINIVAWRPACPARGTRPRLSLLPQAGRGGKLREGGAVAERLFAASWHPFPPLTTLTTYPRSVAPWYNAPRLKKGERWLIGGVVFCTGRGGGPGAMRRTLRFAPGRFRARGRRRVAPSSASRRDGVARPTP